jgi:hypothetical protein
VGDDATPTPSWRRVPASPVPLDVNDPAGMGVKGERVIRIGVRHNPNPVLSDLFGGDVMAIERSSYARPREERLITLDGQYNDGGSVQYISAN